MTEPTSGFRAWFLMAAGALALAACQTTRDRDNDAVAEATVPTSAHSILAALEARHGGPPWPAGPDLVRTTRADIYLGNLDGRIDALARRDDPLAQRDRAALLAYRYSILGRLGDAEAALELVQGYMVQSPDDAEALLLRGNLRGTFHRFVEARQDIERALRSEPAAQRALDELDLASGGHHALAERLAGRDTSAEGLYDLALRGNLAVQQGDAAQAEHWFRQAQFRYRDVSPLPLAWLHTQQGIAWLRFGDIERAQRFFEAAHLRLPQYYLAAEHLAETEFLLGRPERARELYRLVVAQTDNPAFHAALAEVEAELGDLEAAEASLRRAREGYQSLLARHPAAFADHAAAFHLERDETEPALALARLNLSHRQDVMAWLLLAEAEHAAGHRRAACRALAAAKRTGLRPPELDELSERVRTCGRGRTQ
ncbi:MAG TPA: hypothetical protein PKZ76_08935 [Xanthomonadaceae bacterium]|nr:hypothetical protein [Xanthomonadaceae bacterium]